MEQHLWRRNDINLLLLICRRKALIHSVTTQLTPETRHFCPQGHLEKMITSPL